MCAIVETCMRHNVPVPYESLFSLLCSGQENTVGDGDLYLPLEFDKRCGAIHIYKGINVEWLH